MTLISWEYGMLITRWLLYLGIAASVGGAASLYLLENYGQLKKALLHYLLLAAIIGLIAAISHFLIRVGGVLEEGITGMFEPDMLSMMWESPVGDALLLRILGFLLFIVVVIFYRFMGRLSPEEPMELGALPASIALIGLGLIALSFTKAGHAVGQPLLFQWALVTHILLTAWWLGSLYPLWLVCHKLAFNEAHGLLEKFGHLAVVAVVILLLCGLFLSYQLTGWDTLLSSDYGNFLLVKVALVAVMLIMAALHKGYLVPQLLSTKNATTLKRSILLEKLIGASILATTTVMTTLIGPVH